MAARTVLSVLAGAAVGVSGQIVVLERAQQLQMLPEKSPRIEKRPRAYVSTRKADGWVAGREAKVGMVGALSRSRARELRRRCRQRERQKARERCAVSLRAVLPTHANL